MARAGVSCKGVRRVLPTSRAVHFLVLARSPGADGTVGRMSFFGELIGELIGGIIGWPIGRWFRRVVARVFRLCGGTMRPSTPPLPSKGRVRERGRRGRHRPEA